MLAVVEDDFEKPFGWQCGARLVLSEDREMRRAVAVLDALQVAIGDARLFRTVPLVGLGRVNGVRVFVLVAVDDRVTLIVVALADEPGEDASWDRRGRRCGYRRFSHTK